MATRLSRIKAHVSASLNPSALLAASPEENATRTGLPFNSILPLRKYVKSPRWAAPNSGLDSKKKLSRESHQTVSNSSVTRTRFPMPRLSSAVIKSLESAGSNEILSPLSTPNGTVQITCSASHVLLVADEEKEAEELEEEEEAVDVMVNSLVS